MKKRKRKKEKGRKIKRTNKERNKGGQHKYLTVTPEITPRSRPSVGKLTGRRYHPVGHFGQGQPEVGT
jgi:hypothetical protein